MAKELLEELDTLIKTENLLKIDGLLKAKSETSEKDIHPTLQFMCSLINKLTNLIKLLDSDLVSVKHQKTLKTCFQLITSLGILPCLLPGLGIPITKRCEHGSMLNSINIDDITKYKHLKIATDFFIQAYRVPVLKNIIMTYHLSDYLASLIQLAFAPLKKPGIYGEFVMSEELYDSISADKQKYAAVYEHLVVNTFQPSLMKELLVLQGIQDPSPPKFAINVISKELSRRLLAAGGLLSLMRCFIESYKLDVGVEWKQIEMLCKITSTVQGQLSEVEYLKNICNQLKEVLASNNIHYVTVSSACLESLNNKYKDCQYVKEVIEMIINPFSEKFLNGKVNLPGTLIFSYNELHKRVNFLCNCFLTSRMGLNLQNIIHNLYFLFQLRMKLNENEEMHEKTSQLIIKCFEALQQSQLSEQLDYLLYGTGKHCLKVSFTLVNGLITVKSESDPIVTNSLDNISAFISLLKKSSNTHLIEAIFIYSLNKMISLTNFKAEKANKELLLVEENVELFDHCDQDYAATIQLLGELCLMDSVVQSIKRNPSVLFEFIKTLLTNIDRGIHESSSIALILLNTILVDMKESDLHMWGIYLLEPLQKINKLDGNPDLKLLANEALSIFQGKRTDSFHKKSKFQIAIDNVMDNLLPVRAHGIIEITKLIRAKDVETLSKKHFIFCILQQHLKDEDSYVYLASINGLAALCTHCTEDVLQLLCKEFLEFSSGEIEVRESVEKKAQLRMKVGDIIVRTISELGEMAVIHKTLLLNTMLCACRDEDDLVRASALSNLAEIARVINYRVGSIIFEILLCISGTIESDKSPECRRAAVMAIASLLKGIDKSTLLQFKEVLLPIYRYLKALYSNDNEDEKVRLHAQLALEQLNEVVNDFLFPPVEMEKNIFVLNKPD